MPAIPKSREQQRNRRHLRVRKKVTGTPERPRLVVFRSLKHITVQLVDDTGGDDRVIMRIPGERVVEEESPEIVELLVLAVTGRELVGTSLHCRGGEQSSRIASAAARGRDAR